MKLSGCAFIALSLAVSLVGVFAAESSPDNKAHQIREIETIRLQARVDAEIEIARPYHADDFQLISPGGMVFSKNSHLEAVGSGQLRYLTFEAASPIEVRLHGEGAVIRLPVVDAGRLGRNGT